MAKAGGMWALLTLCYIFLTLNSSDDVINLIVEKIPCPNSRNYEAHPVNSGIFLIINLYLEFRYKNITFEWQNLWVMRQNRPTVYSYGHSPFLATKKYN